MIKISRGYVTINGSDSSSNYIVYGMGSLMWFIWLCNKKEKVNLVADWISDMFLVTTLEEKGVCLQSFSNEFSKYFVQNHDNFDNIIEDPVNQQVNMQPTPRTKEEGR